MDIKALLGICIEQRASDLHLSVGLPPILRIDGELKRLSLPELDQQSVHQMLYSLMNDKERKAFEHYFEVDFSFDREGLGRFRANLFNHSRGMGGAFRVIPSEIPSFRRLGFPDIFTKIALLPKGLVLITGPTGSGKSTTLAAMIDYINNLHHKHILTIEDPIEFVHQSEYCLIHQREVHRHTSSFQSALRSALREDPDIIMVGELRDLESIRLALTAAETGHLVLGTLHTSSAAKTISRIIDVFPAEENSTIRALLSESLQAVIAQNLLKRASTVGRIAAFEIMICNGAIRHLIREEKIAQIYSAIQTGQALGMQTFDQHLERLVAQQEVSPEVAYGVGLDQPLFSQANF